MYVRMKLHGFGLTYSRIEIKDVKSQDEAAKDKDPTLKVTAKNTGEKITKDVIEVYVKNQDSEYAPLNPVLCGLKKTELAAGENPFA